MSFELPEAKTMVHPFLKKEFRTRLGYLFYCHVQFPEGIKCCFRKNFKAKRKQLLIKFLLCTIHGSGRGSGTCRSGSESGWSGSSRGSKPDSPMVFPGSPSYSFFAFLPQSKQKQHVLCKRMLLEIFYFTSFLKPFLVARATVAKWDMMTLRDDSDKNNADKYSLLEINSAN